jgi:hypothetical protein
MSLPAQYAICPYCSYVGGVWESECPRPRCSGGSIGHFDASRFPTLLWVVRHRAGEVVFFPPQSFGRDRGSSKKAQAGPRAFLRVGIKGEGTVEILKDNSTSERAIAADTPQRRYENAVRSCIAEIELLTDAMGKVVATLRRVGAVELPPEVAETATKEIRTIAAEIANGLTRGSKSVTRTLPAAMLAAERTIIQAAEGGAPVTRRE